jgi:transcription initiation factor TFIIIB Brf1 subunit/transcription initiation factor TFIIB
MKCPNCNSSRITKSQEGIKCKRCGYINKQFINTDTLIKQEDKWKTKD